MRFSQYEEDELIARFFGHDYIGTFLDIGAADGLLGSNTRALFLRGWSGWLVEPQPSSFGELFRLYQTEKGVALIHAALSRAGQPIQFYHDGRGNGQHSTGHEDTFNLAHLKHLFTGSYWIPTITPQKLYEIIGYPRIDFVSLDCEGFDIEIAQSSRELFKTVRLLCYETDLPGRRPGPEYDRRWCTTLEALGFTKVIGKTFGNTLETGP